MVLHNDVKQLGEGFVTFVTICAKPNVKWAISVISLTEMEGKGGGIYSVFGPNPILRSVSKDKTKQSKNS